MGLHPCMTSKNEEIEEDLDKMKYLTADQIKELANMKKFIRRFPKRIGMMKHDGYKIKKLDND